MKLSSRFSILIFAGLTLLLVACKNKNAMQFKHALDIEERKITHMLIGRDASESRKQEYIIDDNLDKAMLVVDEQLSDFDKVMATVKGLNTDGMSKGLELKQAKLAYYKTLRDLHGYAKREIAQQKRVRETKDKQRELAQHELIELAKAKQQLYDKVYEADEKLYQTLAEFDKANGL